MKKIIRTTFIILIIFFAFSFSVYSAMIYDMQKVNANVEKPTAEFLVEYQTSDGEYGEVGSNSKFYDSDIYSFDQSPSSIKVPVGTKINFTDLSEPGSGTRIKAYDFQVYTPSESKLYYLTSPQEMPSMTLDEEGKYEFYLCVMDNYQRVNGYDNWSVNGNHRWLTKRQDNSLDKFWWYFSQVNIYVYGVDDEEPEIEEPPIIDEPEIEEPEIINHAPEIHIIKPDKYYPIELTSIGVKTNTVKWTYYDEDGDEFDHGAYELYKKISNEKVLIQSDDYITDEDDLHIDIVGEMGEKFSLMMYVYDSEGSRASKGVDIEILSFDPKIQIVNNDRTYLEDDLDIEVKRIDDGFEKYFDVNYVSWEVVDEDGNKVESGEGKIPSKLILKEKYFEDKSYLIRQTIKKSNSTLKTFESRFYIVPILPPKVSLDMINGYIGETKETGLIITQVQSPLKGNLKDYVYSFTNSDGYYEIYYGSSLKYKNDGLCYEIELDEKFEQGKTYKLIQYVTNGAGKTGVGSTNIQIKETEQNELSLQIIERDNNPLTPFDEIYPREKIYLKSILKCATKILKIESWIQNEKGENVYFTNDLFNGLVQINEIGNYEAFTKVWFEDNEILTANASFVVKPIKSPFISHDLVKNTYFKTEVFSPNMQVKDLNISEEHPFGYEIKTNYEWNDLLKTGLFKSEKLNDYENKKRYTLIQHAINAEFEEINSSDDVTFYLDNILPTIEVTDYFECSVGEEVQFEAVAYDEDGQIVKFETELQNSISEIDLHSTKMNLTFLSDQIGTFKKQIVCMDDSGDECIKNIFFKVNDNKEYPYIKLVTNEKDRMKENRYLQIEFGNEFGLENNFKINNQIIKDEIYNTDYHLVFESDDRVGLYFKHEGIFELSNSIFVNNKEIKRTLTLQIRKDESPCIEITSEKELYRNNETKEAETEIKYSCWTDDEIEKIEIFVEGKLNKSINDGEQINIGFGKNVLGEKTVTAKIYETHNFLPAKDHLLYWEIVGLMKSSNSQMIKVNILNMKPEINLNIKSNNKIRIIK